MLTWVLVFVGGFLFGVVTLAALEALGVHLLLERLNTKIRLQEAQLSTDHSSSKELDPHQSLDFSYNKKGIVWVLEFDKVPKERLLEKAPKEQKKKKKEVVEVTPVQRFAKVKDGSLILTESDGSSKSIQLKGCTVEAVSATSLPSRKWAKRYPIRVENNTTEIYNGNRTIYIYLETSWEKESWCKALRLASCDDKQRLYWFNKLNEDFHNYLTSLSAEYPSFMKPSVGLNAEPVERVSTLDGSTSKVRVFLKKLAKKATKAGVDGKGGTFSLGKSHSYQDSVLASTSSKIGLNAKTSFRPVEEDTGFPTSSNFSHTASHSHNVVASEIDSDDRLSIDDGTLCWNLLISRLFFDAKSNVDIKNSVQARIQKTLSNMRIPSYIGEVICTNLDLGNLPPYIHGIRVLPMDVNEVWAWDCDVEYCGGLVLDIETRLEVHDQDLQKGMVLTNSVGDVSPDLLEGFEYLGKKLNLSEGSPERKDEGDPKLGSQQSSTSVSRWKTILNSVAKQVSQVPLSLSLRVTSLRGTLRLHIKPPPTDCIWFGFTSAPDIDFDLETSVGDHKIATGHIATFLINRFKLSIRESMVLPHCESLCIPWMQAEKNDWAPRKVAPFLWLKQETASHHSTSSEAVSSQSNEVKDKTEAMGTSNEHPEIKYQKPNIKPTPPPNSDSLSASPRSSSSPKQAIQNSISLQDLKAPLLASAEPQDTFQQSRKSASDRRPSPSLVYVEKQDSAVEEDHLKPKKLGRKARMLDLGKKMGEKLEEKRRHIEEKGRNIVEKMRGP